LKITSRRRTRGYLSMVVSSADESGKWTWRKADHRFSHATAGSSGGFRTHKTHRLFRFPPSGSLSDSGREILTVGFPVTREVESNSYALNSGMLYKEGCSDRITLSSLRPGCRSLVEPICQTLPSRTLLSSSERRESRAGDPLRIYGAAIRSGKNSSRSNGNKDTSGFG
jgi:hypothetical protein